MRLTRRIILALAVLHAVPARAQTEANLVALRGLRPAALLATTEAGRAALAANFTVTGALQSGTQRPPTPLPFAGQQQLAVRDAFITGGNAAELADGLGTRLGGAYQSLARYTTPREFTSAGPAVAALIAYSNATTAADSNMGKYFFANGTVDGEKAVSAAAGALLSGGAAADVFGRAYGRPAGSAGADEFGNSRPFQTLPALVPIAGPDYFGTASDSMAFLTGPGSDLRDSPSFPSGHTTYGTMESMLLAILVPERYEQMVARGAEYGHSRILLGAHYAMDVIAGRTLALHDVAHLLANDPAYVNQVRRGGTIADYPAAVDAARAELQAALRTACGDTVAACAREDTGRFADPAALDGFMAMTLGYGLPAVYPTTGAEDVGRLAPEAGRLLTAAFPHLSLDQANAILTETEGPGGGFLDDGSGFGVYSRLNLVAAARKARALAPSR